MAISQQPFGRLTPNFAKLLRKSAEQIGNTKPGTTIGQWGDPDAMELWNSDKAAADLAQSKNEDYKSCSKEASSKMVDCMSQCSTVACNGKFPDFDSRDSQCAHDSGPRLKQCDRERG